MSDIHEKLAYMEFYMRENALEHMPVEREMLFYNCVKNGDLDGVNESFNALGSKGFGVLSDDKLRNLKYHLIITIAFITRFCVEGGMERETAYNLSDLYIRRTDKAQTAEQINDLHKSLILDFTRRMSAIKRAVPYSKPIIQCFEYIYNHLNEKITLNTIAESIGLSPAYLSRLFHKETGKTVKEYILDKRIETACNMLMYSEYDAADIGEFLAFSSHSHFIEAFKKRMNMTPREYRNKNFHASSGIKGGVKNSV